jgi:hypothetical protein
VGAGILRERETAAGDADPYQKCRADVFHSLFCIEDRYRDRILNCR